jgi:hypothetical protein
MCRGIPRALASVFTGLQPDGNDSVAIIVSIGLMNKRIFDYSPFQSN